MASQLELQQKASSAHTALQHVSESQVGVACGVKHEPEPATPHEGPSGVQVIVSVPALVGDAPDVRRAPKAT